MQSISAPLQRLHEDGAWFARANEVRLWVVRCSDTLRATAVGLIPKFEFHADNRSPWPLLTEGHGAGDDGWTSRANRLLADWSRRVAAFASSGVVQDSAAGAKGAQGVDAFARAAVAMLAAMRAPLAGLVVVLAPAAIERPDVLEKSLTQLLGRADLANVRWVLVMDARLAAPQKLVGALGPERAQVTDCVVDPAQQRRDLAAMLAPVDPRRFGVAFPAGATPPRRVDDPPPLLRAERDAALRVAGIDPALLDHGPEIRAEVLHAALALAAGQGSAAIEHQRKARALCERLGLLEMQIVATIALASYLSGLDQREEAKRELSAAIATARAHARTRLESQALLALGLLHNLDHEPRLAFAAYTDAARVAEAGEAPMLAIEGWRMAGQLAAQSRQVKEAEAAFGEALRVAASVEPAVARGSSAAEAARLLAAIYARKGMTDQATSLYAQADVLEQGEVAGNVSE